MRGTEKLCKKRNPNFKGEERIYSEEILKRIMKSNHTKRVTRKPSSKRKWETTNEEKMKNDLEEKVLNYYISGRKPSKKRK